MNKSDLNEELKKEFNILTRFLKDNEAYASFLRYLMDKRVSNNLVWVGKTRHNIFDMIAIRGTTVNIISFMLTWNKTKEGYDFWQNLHSQYNKIISCYHHEQRKNNKASS
jgi:hypothetical protein